jgi:hypothetical protein
LALQAHVADLSAKGGQELFSNHRQFRLYKRLPKDANSSAAERIGFEVHLDARVDAVGDHRTASFNGMHKFASSTPVFKYTNEATLDFLCAAMPFTDVPDAQNAKPKKYDDNPAKRVTDRNKLAQDVREVSCFDLTIATLMPLVTFNPK